MRAVSYRREAGVHGDERRTHDAQRVRSRPGESRRHRQRRHALADRSQRTAAQPRVHPRRRPARRHAGDRRLLPDHHAPDPPARARAPGDGREGQRGRPEHPLRHHHRRRIPAALRDVQHDAGEPQARRRPAPLGEQEPGPEARPAGREQRGPVRVEPAEERVPGQRQPRAAHAAEFDPRLRRPAEGRADGGSPRRPKTGRATSSNILTQRPATCWS